MSRRQGMRVSRTMGKSPGVVEKAAVGLFRWAATDHSGTGRMLDNMPPMGFIDTIVDFHAELTLGLHLKLTHREGAQYS